MWAQQVNEIDDDRCDRGSNNGIGCFFIGSCPPGFLMFLVWIQKRYRSHRYVAAEEFHSTLMGVFPSELSSVFPWLNFFLGTQQAWATGWGWDELGTSFQGI